VCVALGASPMLGLSLEGSVIAEIRSLQRVYQYLSYPAKEAFVMGTRQSIVEGRRRCWFILNRFGGGGVGVERAYRI